MRRGGGQGRSRTAGPSTHLTAPCRLCAAGDLRRRREPPHADHPFRALGHESAKGSHAPIGGPWHGRCFRSTPPTRASSPPLTGPPEIQTHAWTGAGAPVPPLMLTISAGRARPRQGWGTVPGVSAGGGTTFGGNCFPGRRTAAVWRHFRAGGGWRVPAVGDSVRAWFGQRSAGLPDRSLSN